MTPDERDRLGRVAYEAWLASVPPIDGYAFPAPAWECLPEHVRETNRRVAEAVARACGTGPRRAPCVDERRAIRERVERYLGGYEPGDDY